MLETHECCFILYNIGVASLERRSGPEVTKPDQWDRIVSSFGSHFAGRQATIAAQESATAGKD